MKSKEFLIKRLNELVSVFTDMRIRYEFDQKTFVHKVEVTPLELFEANENYLIAEAKLESDFEKKFPNENIIFISEDSLTQIHKPDCELGFNMSIGEQTFINFHYDLTEIFNSFSDAFNFEIQGSLINPATINCGLDFFRESQDYFEFEVNLQDGSQINEDQDENYALAA